MRASVPPPYEHDHENEVVLFGQTNFRNQGRKFGIKTDDRRRHVYVIGKTGMGKTTLLENMVLGDIYAGHGLAYIDPHGDSAKKFLDFIPPHRINDVVYFNPTDMEFPVGFNILETVDESQKHLVASGLMGVFKKIWPDVWSSRMEYILLNTIMALLDFPGSTLLGINRLLSDEEYRGRVVSLIQDPVVKTFWVKEFASFSEKYRTEAVAPLQNKVGQFLSATIIRNIVAQVKSTINIREIMDTRKIFIVNLSKGSVGEENSRLLGAMIITRLQLAAMERVDMPEEDRQDFYLYVDEFQNFATQSFANILSEARKYRLALIVAHQYIEQLEEEVRAAVFGNVGTIIAFRVGAADASFMENEFMPRFTPEDLVNLKKFEIYLKLMIDGASSEPFSANTLAPIAENTGSMEKVIRVSRERYSTPRKVIEDRVIKWSGFGTVDTGQTLMTEDEESAAIEAKIEELAKTSPDVGEMAQPAGGGFGGGAKKKKKAEFQVPCSVCQKISELTFEPDWSKPWFCKEHLEMKQKGLLPRTSAPASIKVVPAPAPVVRAIQKSPAIVPPKPQQSQPKAPPPKVNSAQQAKMAPPGTADVKPVSLGTLPSRQDATPKRAESVPFNRSAQKSLPKPQLAATAEQLTGIPASSHKPRIVIGGAEDDVAGEILKTAEKPIARREVETAQGAQSAPVVQKESAGSEPVRQAEPFGVSPAIENVMDERPVAEKPAAAPMPKLPEQKPPTPPEQPPAQPPAPTDAPAGSWQPGQVIKF